MEREREDITDKEEGTYLEMMRNQKEVLEILEKKLKIEKNNSKKRFFRLNEISKKSRQLLTKNDDRKNYKNNLIGIIISNHNRLKKLETIAVDCKNEKYETKKILKKIEKDHIFEKLDSVNTNLDQKLKEKHRVEDKIKKKIREEIYEKKEIINESNAESILSNSSKQLKSSRTLKSTKSFANIKRLPKRDYSKSEKISKKKKKKRKKKEKSDKGIFIYKKNEFVDMNGI